MIFCTYCGKSFTRKEHLERHIPSRKCYRLLSAPHSQKQLWTPSLTGRFQIQMSSPIAVLCANYRFQEGKQTPKLVDTSRLLTILQQRPSPTTPLHIPRSQRPNANSSWNGTVHSRANSNRLHKLCKRKDRM